MRVSIFGLGYVGAVSAGCFADLGHEVIGVDPIGVKVDQITAGNSPVVEHELDKLIANAVAAGRLRATMDAREAIKGSDISLICVGTPSRRDGSMNLDYIRRVCRNIGENLAALDRFHVVALRSTIFPGLVREAALDVLESSSGGRLGRDFGFVVNPEFLREGVAVNDFRNPPYTLIGTNDERSATTMRELYAGIDAPFHVTDIDTASMVKYANNAFHAAKIIFGNEFGALCRVKGIDSHAVMDLVCADTKLNISPLYLKPGFAFGGSCLPKDLRAILDCSRQTAVQLPMLAGVMQSNDIQIRRLVDEIVAGGKRKTAVLGLAFKPGTDDLRESPIVIVVEALLGKGFDLSIYDPNVSLAALIGANKEYILHEIPHISSLLRSDLEQTVKEADLLIIANRHDDHGQVIREYGGSKAVIDLVRQFSPENAVGSPYLGIGW